MGSNLGTDSNKPERVIKGPVGRCKPTTPSSFLLASNGVYTGAVAKSSANGLLDDGFESW